MCKISAQHLKACKRKVRKTAHFLYSKFTKRHNSFKNWRKVTTLKLALYYIKTKLCAKFQRNMSEQAGKTAETVYFLYSKIQKRHNSLKIDSTGRHSNLLCCTSKQSRAKFQLNISKHVGEKCENCVFPIF